MNIILAAISGIILGTIAAFLVTWLFLSIVDKLHQRKNRPKPKTEEL